MRRLQTLFIILATFALTVVTAPLVWRMVHTSIDRIDRNFEGIFTTHRDADSAGIQEPKHIVRLLTIHGIGRHCIGYAREFVEGIAKQSGLTPTDTTTERLLDYTCPDIIDDYAQFDSDQYDLCKELNQSSSHKDMCHILEMKMKFNRNTESKVKRSSFFPGYIRVSNYESANRDSTSPHMLRHYELTWDPATRWAKHYYVLDQDREFDTTRDWVNRKLKSQLVNDSITDAVLYLSDYQALMLHPVLMAFCAILSDATEVNQFVDQSKFHCDLAKIRDALDGSGNLGVDDEIVVITHSLGSRMLFDALGMLSDPSLIELNRDKLARMGVIHPSGTKEGTRGRIDDIIRVFAGSVSKVYTMANQVPLLQLGVVETPLSYDFDIDIGENFRRFLELRSQNPAAKQPLQVIAMSDPNDLLSYNLKCWYYRKVLSKDPRIKRKVQEYFEEKGVNKPNYSKPFASCGPYRANAVGAESIWAALWAKVRAFVINDDTSEVGPLWSDVWALVADSIVITEVRLRFAAIGYPTVFTDPLSAHARYFEDETIHKLIACGGEDETDSPLACGR